MEGNENPKENANFLSKLFFWSEICMVVNHWKKASLYSEDDIYAPLPKHRSRKLGDKLEVAWMGEENFKKTPSLIRAFFNVFGLEFFLYGVLYFPIHVGVAIAQPYLLGQLLSHFQPKNSKVTYLQAYVCAGLLIVVLFVNTLCYNAFNMGLLSLGIKIRIACNSLIYRKSLRLKETTFQKVKVGQMINLLSNDVKRFDLAFPLLHFIWIAPLDLIIMTSYLMVTLGSTASPGIIVLCLAMFLQMFLSKQIATRRELVAVNTDKRMCTMSDIITNIKTIKINTWEKPFIKLVQETRNSEIKEIKSANHLRFINNTFKFFLTEICSYFCILATVANDVTLSSEFVFVLRSIFDIIKGPVVTNLPEAVIHFAEVKTTIKRVEEFLTLDFQDRAIIHNISCSCVLKSLQFFKTETASISAINVDINNLRDVNFSLYSGDLVGITGGAGSGKSTLLKLILKEVEFRGHLYVSGNISYASQESWIFPLSIKKNILFGEDMNLNKYKKVIHICCLEHDLSSLPLGDETLVGERGIMLSCGQKARIHLARAVYKDADIYLLDNPLAAVETVIAQKIFNHCIRNYLKDKCVLMATQQQSYLKYAKKIFHLKNNRLVITKKESDNFEDDCDENLDMKCDTMNTLVVGNKESCSENNTFSILNSYSRFGGGKVTIIKILLMFVLVQFLVIIIDCFVTFWVNLEEEPWQFGHIKTFFFTNRNLQIYSLLLALLIIATALSNWFFLQFCTNASIYIHDAMSSRILHATMGFFSTYASGRILNRFSKDLGDVDECTPVNLKNALEMLLSTCAAGIIISALNYYMIVPTVFLFIICLFYYRLFNSQSLVKLDAISQSSICTHITATMQGMSTIRSSNIQKMLQEEFDSHQDGHTSRFYAATAIDSAFNFWSDLTRVVYTGITILSFFFVKSLVADVGLAITQSMQFTVIQETVKAWNDLNSSVTSIERVNEYLELPSEPETQSSFGTLCLKSGSINFKGVSMKYSSHESYVLKQTSFNIQSGEKIGILGNNSSGKSALISVVFRVFNFEGTVFIDNKDIKTLPLGLLRAQIIVIPSKPLLFPGTVRQNLDPFEEFNDFQIWQALRTVNLRDFVGRLPHSLNTKLTEENSLFTMSQRRLLCLVRALLKQVKIIILDRSSSDLDSRTNRRIQTILKRKFKQCTVLLIGRSLKDVINSDKVLILSDGCVVMFGSPRGLKQISCRT